MGYIVNHSTRFDFLLCLLSMPIDILCLVCIHHTASYPSITMRYTHTSQLSHTACVLYTVYIPAGAVLAVLVAFLPWQALGYLLCLYIARIPHMLRHTVY